jgi:hypothetical protein
MCRIGYRPLRGLCKFFGSTDPGVPLRYTPGFTLSPAIAGWLDFRELLERLFSI